MGLRQVEQGFSSFFAKFLAYLVIFQSGPHQRCSGNFEKSSNMAKIWQKNEEKPCSTCLKPISPWHFQNPKPRFWVHTDPSLTSYRLTSYIIIHLLIYFGTQLLWTFANQVNLPSKLLWSCNSCLTFNILPKTFLSKKTFGMYFHWICIVDIGIYNLVCR